MSDIKTQLENWKKKLLDLGKRNRMLNFKESKSSTLQIISPNAEALFEGLFNPLTYEVGYALEEDENGTKGSFKSKKDKTIIVDKNETDGRKVLHKLRGKAKNAIEEQGINLLYIGFGFLEWKESTHSEIVFKSPLILVPVSITMESIHSPYCITIYEEEAIVNPTLKYKMKESFNMELPEFAVDGSDQIMDYLAQVLAMTKKDGWTVNEETHLGFFSFTKLNMYMDLNNNVETIIQNPLIKGICGEQLEGNRFDSDEEISIDKAFKAEDSFCVVDSDSSQLEAIYHASKGKSFVLQGPPGTGKSQTITNIIATSIATGKRVLFVSEKMAALEVVYNNLKKVGLEDFCLQLHSSKANKKEVVGDLCSTLLKGKTVAAKSLISELSELEIKKAQLNNYAQVLGRRIEKLDCSIFELFGKLAKFINAPDVSFGISNIKDFEKAKLTACQSLINEYIRYTKVIGFNYKNNPHFGLVVLDNSFSKQTEMEVLFNSAIVKFEDLKKVNEKTENLLGLRTKNNIFSGNLSRELIAAIARIRNASVTWFDERKNVEIEEKVEGLKEQIVNYNASITLVKLIDKELIEEDTDKLLKDFRRDYAGGLRILKRSYRAAIKLIKENTLKTGGKVTYKKAIEILKIINVYKCSNAFMEKNSEFFAINLNGCYKKEQTNCDEILFQLRNIQKEFALIKQFALPEFPTAMCEIDVQTRLLQCQAHLDTLESANEITEELKKLFDKKVVDFVLDDLDFAIEKLRRSKENMGNLADWINFYRLLKQLQTGGLINFIDVSIDANIQQEDLERSFLKKIYYFWIDEISRKEPILQNFTREKQDDLIKDFCEKDKLQFKIAQARIREKLSAQRPNVNLIAQNSEVSILLRESEKKRKLLPIRKLFMQIPNLLYTIKPCLLMSPMSVSQFVTSSNSEFDVVVFDEASQIFPEDALGAIYRGKQLIIVGDNEQLPPTNFFNAGTIDNEYDTDDEDNEDNLTFESILDVGSTFLNRVRLRWHYRSRYEDLITFSNRKIYKNELITFPASQKKREDTGVEYVFVENGVYERSTSRSNKIEALRVRNLVFEHFKKYPTRSIGVVAFSEAQAEAIDNEIANFRKANQRFETFFKEDNAEPFFVKSIESVQGDERDTIIFSIGYGKDSNGKMFMNFGPLSRDGGERRLNVAITRAKINIKLVGSIHSTDIISDNAKLGVKLLRSYIEFAQNGVKAIDAETSISADDDFDSPFEKEVYDTLTRCGYKLDIQVGCSGYRIDMAVQHPTKNGVYVLGIECDGATYHSSRTARDRDRLRGEVLQKLDWNMYHIWSTDWFRRRETEVAKLLDAVEKAIKQNESRVEESISVVIDENVENAIVETALVDSVQDYDFKRYKYINWNDFSSRVAAERKLQAIIDEESPICEELLLKRVCGMYGREKVTTYVREQFLYTWKLCRALGLRRNGNFYFSEKQTKIEFRVPTAGDEPRKVEHIHLDELVDGVFKIVKANVGIGKSALSVEIARQLGFKRTTEQMVKFISIAIDEAELLKLIEHKNEMYSIKAKD